MKKHTHDIRIISMYFVVLVCLVGYHFTQHNAFLFVYAFINWIGLISLVIWITIIWKVINGADEKEIKYVNDILLQLKQKMKFTHKNIFTYAFTFSCIGLLLYWQAFATATPLILLVIIGFFLRYFVNGIFQDEQIKST